MVEKVKLTGGPDKTVTWIWLEENGIDFQIERETRA